MKLLFVHNRLGAFAGAEANVFQTAGEFRRRGHTVGLLHGPGTGKSEDLWRQTFQGCFPLVTANDDENVEHTLDQFKPDVIYVHNLSDVDALETIAQNRTPVVRMVHDHEMYCPRSYKYHYFSRNICQRPFSPYCVFPCGAFVARNNEGRFPLKWISYQKKKREIRANQRFATCIVATHYMKDELLRNRFPADKIEVHAPIPCSDATIRQSSYGERNLIVYAGQIVRGKGVDVLLESLALVDTAFECLIVGDGNHRIFCEKLSQKLGLDHRVHFIGYVPPQKLKHFYSECTLAVLSSVWPEPFGAVGLEGMRHSLPIIAFDAGGIKEWLIDGYNGYLVPWMNREKFAGRVKQLLLNKSLAREMGERGRQMMTERYDFSAYIDHLEKLFNRVAGQRPSTDRL